jgi:hypothetical protein
MAQWLTSGGFPATNADVENANRPAAMLVEHVFVKTVAADRFIAFAQTKFLAFEQDRLLPT